MEKISGKTVLIRRASSSGHNRPEDLNRSSNYRCNLFVGGPPRS
jgi:hypothetical protein